MLRQLLQCMAQEGTCLTRDLARRLGVSEAMVEQMMADLARQGYLRRVADSSGGDGCCCTATSTACDRCALNTLCATHHPPLWGLTAKGQRWLFPQS